MEICELDRAVIDGVGAGGTNSVEVGKIVGKMIGGTAVGVSSRVMPTSVTAANGGIEVGAI